MRIRILLALFVLVSGLAAIGPSAPAVTCPIGQICVTVDTSTTSGPAKLRAQGFLHGITDQTPLSYLSALKPQFWRTADVESGGGVMMDDRARAAGAKITYLISDEWAWAAPGNFSHTWACDQANQSSVGIKPPYADGFVAWEPFLHNLVASKIAAGENPAFWDVDNEPDITGCVLGGRNKQLRYEEFKRAVSIIKSHDPAAKVVAPSIDVYAAAYGPTGCRNSFNWIDLSTMLDHARTNNVQYSALNWHELADRDQCNPPQGIAYVSNPPVVTDHINQTRALVAARQPQVGNPQMHINEYGLPSSFLVPGWETGLISALEKGNIDAAMKSCWTDIEGGNVNTCFDPAGVVNGLFTTSHLPQATYWVHRVYADMSCPDATCAVRTTTRVATSATDVRVTGFATRDDVLSRVSLLVGRHQSCTKAVNQACYESPSAQPPAASSTLTIGYPYGGSTARVIVEKIPNVRGAITSMTTVSDSTATVTGGNVTATIPSFADGESYSVRVQPV